MDNTITKNSVDTIYMDVPLFIRMLEYAKEDAKDDMDLHKVTERILNMQGKRLTMEDYADIVEVKESGWRGYFNIYKKSWRMDIPETTGELPDVDRQIALKVVNNSAEAITEILVRELDDQINPGLPERYLRVMNTERILVYIRQFMHHLVKSFTPADFFASED
jgi:hypothetical protein